MADRLSAVHRQQLLALARLTVRAAAAGDPAPDAPAAEAGLSAPGAAFVTLRRRATGDLRGCRGEIMAVRPLAASVIEGATAAAIDDPRFPPVRPGEVDQLTIEISVLTPMVAVAPSAVDPGRHGVMITCRGRRGLLLPQVATELGWDRDQLLEGVCQKAGLPGDAWRRRDARLEVFEAEVWGEDGD